MTTSLSEPAVTSLPVRLITYNIRFAIKHPVPGEEKWAVRHPKLAAQLRFITAGNPSTFICLQEVTFPQLQDIQASLGPSWSHIGRGRADGENGGEFSPVFFRTNHWVCERNDTFWLSETPEKPSRGWDADLPRVVTMGAFRHSGTGTSLVVMSTHLDYRGKIAREKSAPLLIGLAQKWAHHGPVFLGGDFNSTPTSTVYKTLVSGMKDISDLVPEASRYGNQEITYTSFGEAGERPGRLDYLFVLDQEGLQFLTYAILSNRFDDGVFLSDHRPVVADVKVPV